MLARLSDTGNDILTMQIVDGKNNLDSVEYTKIIADKLLSMANITLDRWIIFITGSVNQDMGGTSKSFRIPFEKLSLFERYGNTVAP